VDKKLKEKVSPSGRIYHLYPHVWNPLSFQLGASVGLRRSIMLYHAQKDQFYRPLDLTEPRKLGEKPTGSVSPPRVIPEDLDTLPKKEKLILHIFTIARHSVDFEKHPDHLNSANAAIIYDHDLPNKEDWLPYVQWIFQKANPLMTKYKEVEICMSGPSVVAFALGMAFSRSAHISFCQFFSDRRYRPVLSLKLLEEKLWFD
jgi:hypothetical protein